MIVSSEAKTNKIDQYFGHGLYSHTETDMRFLCTYRQENRKGFDWSLSQADAIIVNELFALSKSCLVITNGQPKVHGFEKFGKEFGNLFAGVYSYRCKTSKGKLQRLADILFGNECDVVYAGLVKSTDVLKNPRAFGFTPFWTFVFMSCDNCKINIEADDILKNDQRLLEQNDVLALLHIDRVALRTSLWAKTSKETEKLFSVIPKLFLLSDGVIVNIFQASIFWGANESAL